MAKCSHSSLVKLVTMRRLAQHVHFVFQWRRYISLKTFFIRNPPFFFSISFNNEILRAREIYSDAQEEVPISYRCTNNRSPVRRMSTRRWKRKGLPAWLHPTFPVDWTNNASVSRIFTHLTHSVLLNRSIVLAGASMGLLVMMHPKRIYRDASVIKMQGLTASIGGSIAHARTAHKKGLIMGYSLWRQMSCLDKLIRCESL